MAENGSLDEMPECPLCMEPMGLDDINFYPCVCRYQICRFCWHRIRTDENGLCPHCREAYSENPAEYTPPTVEQLAKLKSDKKQKNIEKRQKLVESRRNLASVRVVQTNLVFVIGLSPRLADPEVLKKNEFFGKYGRIYKVVINNHTVYSGAQGPSVSAYVTYCKTEDASKAITAVNNAFIDGRYLKASFGTTKYCTNFLRGMQCTKPDCMYLHELGDTEASFTKEDMQLGKHQLYETATLAAASVSVSARDQTAVGTVTGTGGGVKVKHIPSVKLKETAPPDGSESALPATASWASNQKVSTESQQVSQSKESTTKSHSSKGSKHGHKSHHSGRSHTGGSRQLKDGDSNESRIHDKTVPSSSPNHQTPPTTGVAESVKSKAGHFEGSHNRTSSSSSKSFSPDLSPKSTLSQSTSSESLKQPDESDTGFHGNIEPGNDVIDDDEGTECVSHDQDGTEDCGHVTVDNMMVDPADVNTVLGAGLLDAVYDDKDSDKSLGNPPGLVQVEENGVEAITSLGLPADSGQFGALGISWTCPLPTDQSRTDTTMLGQHAEESSHHHLLNQQSEDDLGFDPWDVSKQGLADLLETEAGMKHTATSPLSNGLTTPLDSIQSPSVEDEFRSLFPNVNISFDSSHSSKQKQDKPVPSILHSAVDSATTSSNPRGYIPTQLASALNYSYHPVMGGALAATQSHFTQSSSETFLGQHNPGFPASSIKVNRTVVPTSQTSQTSSIASNWPDLGVAVGNKTSSTLMSAIPGSQSAGVRGQNVSWTDPSKASSLSTGSLGLTPPPPGFSLKTATASSKLLSSTSKDTPSATGLPVGVTALPNSALWNAANKGQMIPNHLLQSWNNFMNFSSLTPAQQQQLARSSQAYQQLLVQQHLLRQRLLMRGNPFLQAQMQAQAQSLRNQMQRTVLRQQQQQQQQGGGGGGATGNGIGNIKSAEKMTSLVSRQSNSASSTPGTTSTSSVGSAPHTATNSRQSTSLSSGQASKSSGQVSEHNHSLGQHSTSGQASKSSGQVSEHNHSSGQHSTSGQASKSSGQVSEHNYSSGQHSTSGQASSSSSKNAQRTSKSSSMNSRVNRSAPGNERKTVRHSNSSK